MTAFLLRHLRCETSLAQRTFVILRKETPFISSPCILSSSMTSPSRIISALSTHPTSVVRCYSTSRRDCCSSPASNTLDDEDVPWENLFKFNYIPIVVILSRLKILQTFVTFTILPYVGHLSFVAKTEPVESFYFIIGLSGVAAIMLYIITRISQVR